MKNFIESMGYAQRWVISVVVLTVLSYIFFYYIAYTGLIVMIVESIICYSLFWYICPKKGLVSLIIPTIVTGVFTIWLASSMDTSSESMQALSDQFIKNFSISIAVSLMAMWSTVKYTIGKDEKQNKNEENSEDNI